MRLFGVRIWIQLLSLLFSQTKRWCVVTETAANDTRSAEPATRQVTGSGLASNLVLIRLVCAFLIIKQIQIREANGEASATERSVEKWSLYRREIAS